MRWDATEHRLFPVGGTEAEREGMTKDKILPPAIHP